jgi:putative mRNA 3-end processing factor
MLISFSDKGLYCAAGDFYIDPWRPVQRAVITHAHSDHARAGHGHYLCQQQSLPLLRTRLGDHDYQGLAWGEKINHRGVTISFHPSGHIIGAAQVRVEYQGEVWVVSGDYKTENDGISGAFEAVRCQHFITESTFGLPVYQWKPQEQVYANIRRWIDAEHADGNSVVLQAYSLGKSQRLIHALRDYAGKVFVHGAVWPIQQALRAAGHDFIDVERIDPSAPTGTYKRSIVISPSAVEGTYIAKAIRPYVSASCSGWMQVRGNRRRNQADTGFVLSDHADWPGLLSAIKATGAGHVYATHGYQSVLARYLTEQGIDGREVKTEYGEEES